MSECIECIHKSIDKEAQSIINYWYELNEACHIWSIGIDSGGEGEDLFVWV